MTLLSHVVGVPWTRRLGAFLAIGTSPGALVLGAGPAMRSGGAVPVFGIGVGATAMAAMLYGQGLLSVLPPVGSGELLADATQSYLGRLTLPLLHVLLGFDDRLVRLLRRLRRGGARRGRLAEPVGPVLLPAPFVLVALAGASLARATGTVDVVAAVSGVSAPLLGNVLVAIAVIAVTFTTLRSGSLALRAVVRMPAAPAILAIAVPGTVLAIARFDRYLFSWLGLLAVLLPPLLVPMVIEARPRRRGHRHRRGVAAMWVHAAVVGLAATFLGLRMDDLAPALGLVVAGTATMLVRSRM